MDEVDLGSLIRSNYENLVNMYMASWAGNCYSCFVVSDPPKENLYFHEVLPSFLILKYVILNVAAQALMIATVRCLADLGSTRRAADPERYWSSDLCLIHVFLFGFHAQASNMSLASLHFLVWQSRERERSKDRHHKRDKSKHKEVNFLFIQKLLNFYDGLT